MAHKYGFASVNSQLNSGRDNQTETQKQIDTLASNVISVRVTDIILDDQHPSFDQLGSWSSVGTIFFEKVEGATDATPEENVTAKPLLPYLKKRNFRIF